MAMKRLDLWFPLPARESFLMTAKPFTDHSNDRKCQGWTLLPMESSPTSRFHFFLAVRPRKQTSGLKLSDSRIKQTANRALKTSKPITNTQLDVETSSKRFPLESCPRARGPEANKRFLMSSRNPQTLETPMNGTKLMNDLSIERALSLEDWMLLGRFVPWWSIVNHSWL